MNKTDMNQLILHIGTMKTGTTALQCFLHDNRERLEKNGIGYYPEEKGEKGQAKPAKDENDPARFMNGRALMDAINRKASNDPNTEITDGLKEKLRALADYAATHRTTIVSNECIWHELAKNPAKWGVLKAVLDEYLPLCSRRFVLYLRPQEEMVLSMYRQFIPFESSPREFSAYSADEQTKSMLDYAATIRTLEEVFGRESITVRRYDTKRFCGGSIFRDFFEATGLEWDETYARPQELLNPSMTIEMCEAIRELAAHRACIFHDRRLIASIAKVFSLTYTEPRGTHYLTYDEQVALRAEYEDGNRRIAAEYFGGGPLFAEVRRDTSVWQRDEERLTRHAREIIAITKIIEEERLELEKKEREGRIEQA